MVKSRQKFPNRGGGSKKIKNVPSSKISQVSEGGGTQNLGTVHKLYLVINYEGFPYVPKRKMFNIDFWRKVDWKFINATV